MSADFPAQWMFWCITTVMLFWKKKYFSVCIWKAGLVSSSFARRAEAVVVVGYTTVEHSVLLSHSTTRSAAHQKPGFPLRSWLNQTKSRPI